MTNTNKKVPPVIFAILLTLLTLGIALPSLGHEQNANDYPTEERVQYVLHCMDINGKELEALRKCSCSIDVIASLMPYEDYERAKVVMTMQQLSSPRMRIADSVPWMVKIADDLKRYQAQSTLECF